MGHPTPHHPIGSPDPCDAEAEPPEYLEREAEDEMSHETATPEDEAMTAEAAAGVEAAHAQAVAPTHAPPMRLPRASSAAPPEGGRL